MKALKFGGSSLADAEQFKKVANIVKAEESRRYVVVSAPGKRFDGDTKITDMLYEAYSIADAGEDMTDLFAKIRGRFESIITGLGLDLDLSKDFDKIFSAFHHHPGRDYAASRGEYLNGKIFAAYIGYDFIDPAKCIFFKENGTFDAERTNEVLSAVLAEHERAVLPGFYGSMPNGTVKTFSRGGSDITGSIVARAVNADLYENWTDVSGFLMADPRVVHNPKPIDEITYRELRELSYMGAGVLHEDAIFPVRAAGISINIRNTNRPEDRGTMIVPHSEYYNYETVITGIAGKKGLSVINIEKDMMNSEIGFGRKVLEVLEEHNVSFEHLPSGIDTMGVVISDAELAGKDEAIVHDIKKAVSPDHISVDGGLALIAVVGRGMISAKGTAGRVFRAIAAKGVNIRMIDQGSSEINIIIGVDESDYLRAIEAIYEEFVK
ncbi:MAG: aspartate kinase [Ruminococcaceae bacterium]|nr:aspartate kinase [Oscillospiraceae bacterium]